MIKAKDRIIGSRTYEEIPKITLNWIRGHDRINWQKASHHLCCGLRDTGKSALGEVIACHYPQIIDVFGSRDNEGLCWLRSGLDDILLVIGENCDMDASYDVERIDRLNFKKMSSYEIVIMVPSFYSTHNNYLASINQITKLFYKRFSFVNPAVILIREAANFTYSRISKGSTDKLAKAEFIQFSREMRHFGYSIFLDTIRWTAVDKEMRDLADYVYLKDQGYIGLQADVKFLYTYINPRSLAGLPPHKFVILTRNASIGIGTSEYPNFHKEPGENLLVQFELYPEFGEELKPSSTQTVGDHEHERIIRLYCKESYTMRGISEQLHRSTQTVNAHIKKHNSAVISQGYCSICRRLQSDLAETISDRPM